VKGLTANRDVCMGYVQRSIGLVTALNPVLGYDRSSEVAKEALATGASVYDLVVQKGWLTKDQLDELLDPARMTSPLAPLEMSRSGRHLSHNTTQTMLHCKKMTQRKNQNKR
jgi:aspartate ammonia-lyase